MTTKREHDKLKNEILGTGVPAKNKDGCDCGYPLSPVCVCDTKHDDGGPAFPSDYDRDFPVKGAILGMSLWDFYAGKALEGFVSGVIANHNYKAHEVNDEVEALEFAQDAATTADAMIAERNKRWPK